MKLLFGKGKIVEENIYKYLDIIKEEKKLFVDIITNYLNSNMPEKIMETVKFVHQYESQADDLRREIEHQLYEKALLPQFRGDILRLMEKLDKLPNQCQSILYDITLQNLKIPDDIKDDISKLIDENLKIFDSIFDLINSLFNDPKNVKIHAENIDKIESTSDRMERNIIKKLFASESIDKCDKILIKELISKIGHFSDFGQIIADVVIIINIKVRV